MAKVPNAVEILPKLQSTEQGARALQTDRRHTDDRQTDGRAIAYSEREPEFTFANNEVRTKVHNKTQKNATSHTVSDESNVLGRKERDLCMCMLKQRSMDVASASLLEIPPQLAYVFSKLDGKSACLL